MPMSSASRVQLAPGVPALESLGVSGPEELLCPGGAPERTGVRVRNAGGDALRGDSPGPRDRAILRFPLPGTPDDEGRLGGRPGEVGTGWVVLSRWHSPSLVALLRSRFTAPRSSSLAEREWNLLCRLLDHGVGVPRPLAVGARGLGLFSRRSFLVTRELRGFEPLALWAKTDTDPARRRRAANALGHLLANVIRAGVILPRLSLAALVIKPEPTGEFGAACEDEAPSVPGKLRMRPLPGVALVEVGGGLLRTELRAGEVRSMLSHLYHDARSQGWITPREARRIAALATRGASDRRALWRALEPA